MLSLVPLVLAALLVSVIAQNQTVSVDSPEVAYARTGDDGSQANGTVGGFMYDGCLGFVSGVSDRGDTVTLSFTGVSASVALYADAGGSTAQLLVDGQPVGSELNTSTTGVHWNATCHALLATTPQLIYGQHTISVVKTGDAGFLWIGNFTFDVTNAGASLSSEASDSSTVTRTKTTTPIIIGMALVFLVTVALGVMGWVLHRRRPARPRRTHLERNITTPEPPVVDIGFSNEVETLPTPPLAAAPWRPPSSASIFLPPGDQKAAIFITEPEHSRVPRAQTVASRLGPDFKSPDHLEHSGGSSSSVTVRLLPFREGGARGDGDASPNYVDDVLSDPPPSYVSRQEGPLHDNYSRG